MGALIVVWFVFWALIGGLVGYAIGKGKGRGTEGFWLGLLLGFIGWIIVGVMSESAEHQQRQATAIAAAVVQATSTSPSVATEPERQCPHCAESVKAAARICRFCGRDIEPLTSEELTAASDAAAAAEIEKVARDYPNEYGIARPFLDALAEAPKDPGAWLAELCKRIQAGAPPARAAERIPRDWSIPVAPIPAPPPAPAGMPDPALAGNYPNVAAAFPTEYNTARAMLAGLATPPDDPGAWVEELCRRINAGAPPDIAAGRIPLDWSKSTVQPSI